MSKAIRLRRAIASALLFPAAIAVHAQQAPSDPNAKPPAKSDAKPDKVETITVKSTPLDVPISEMAQPATVLREDDLRRKRAASLGDTLSGELGVQSSAFGPGSGRPIIRGLDGARIRVLQNGVGTLDVSTISPDHLVATESSHAEQIEILRGPASLLYGSGAIGGVVNVVSNLIPTTPQALLTGDAELRTSTASKEKTGSANLTGGDGNFAWHLDGSRRKTEDYEIAGRVNPNDPDSPSGKLPGSFIDAKGAGAGASWVRGADYFGAGVSGMRNNYGIPSGEGTHIEMKQTRFELGGELNRPASGIERIKTRFAHNDYEHAEIEPNGEVATTFKNKGGEGRVELQHAPVAGLKGALGLQLQARDFSALGEEAIVPKTKSRASGVFLVEQTEIGSWVLSGGARLEREKHRPEGDLPNRSFNLGTFSAGVVWKFATAHNFSVNFSQAQRAPSIEELYSNGPHAATATFDIGDAALKKEASRNVDVTLRKSSGALKWKINLFANRMKDYVFASGVDSDGDGVADRVDEEGALAADGEFLVQQFAQADARLKGYEAEVTYQPAKEGAAVRVFTDSVRGRLKNGGNLPRISPSRVGLELGYTQGPWSKNLTVIRVQKQDQTADLETATPGYTKVNAEVGYQWVTTGASYLFFLQGNNLLDKDIRVHTSYLKDTSPQAGRSFTLGVRATF
jgi:iron complex outermembrane receptor protein